MKPSELDSIRNRIARCFTTAKTIRGNGYDTSYVADGTDFMTRFKAHGIKSPEQLEDDILTLFVWLWSIKDYLKNTAKKNGKDPKRIENIINENKALKYVSDIANRAKHQDLKTSRSGEFCKLVDIGWIVPHAAISNISAHGDLVELFLKDTLLVEIKANIETNKGKKYNAFTILGSGSLRRVGL